MTATAIYQTAATSTGDGRNGRSRTVDGILDVTLATPTELGGAGGATNPEQLFAAGYAACFHSALKLVARRMRVPVQDSAVTAEVGLVKKGPGFGLQAAVEVELPGVDDAVAKQLVDAAHQVCPYSAAIRGNVDVQVSIA
jgi:lipoyl-dependent peroxiredoxin